ncbi:MAG: fasciclin domain-containing protein [Cyanobacteria bacterium J06638_7]
MKKLVALASLSFIVAAGFAHLAAIPSAAAAPLVADKKAMAKKNIVETAAADPRFSTLVAAVQAAGLQDGLASTDNITVFAPTNDAFAALPAGTVENLLLPENREQLSAILTYHVVPSKVMAADVSSGDVPTLNGAELTIDVADGTVTVGGAEVIATDVKASNGVIHLVNRVILPPTN